MGKDRTDNKGCMNEKDTAWMIREDGVAIPCVQHIYGSPDCLEETLYAAEWLYQNTLKEETKDLVLGLICAYAESLSPKGDPVRNLLDQVRDQPYVTLTDDFIREIGGQLVKSAGDLQELNRRVCDALNREFLRARLGGMYHSEEGGRDMYFRISGTDRDWREAIGCFLKDHGRRIDTVTVVYDAESTGHGEFLRDIAGRDIDHVPLTDFLKDTDRPVVI